jgi:hypothetical protein
MSIVTIQSPENVAEFSADKVGNQQFVVRNSSGEKLRIGVRVESEDSNVSDWLSIDGPGEIDLENNTVTEIKVKVAISSEAKAGRSSYHLIVFDANDTNRSGQSEAVYFDIKQVNGKKKVCIPCIIGAIVGGLALIGVIVYIFSSTKVALPDFTQYTLTEAMRFLDEEGIKFESTKKLANPQKAKELLNNNRLMIGQNPPPEAE